MRSITAGKSTDTSPVRTPNARRPSGARRRACGGEQGLRWDAARVQAVAAEEVSLDERDPGAEAGGARGRHEAGGAAADDHQVVAAARRRIPPAARVHVMEQRAVVLVVRQDEGPVGGRRRHAACGRGGGARSSRGLGERAPRDAGHEERHRHGGGEPDEVEDLLRRAAAGLSAGQLGEPGHQRPQVDVHHGPRQHPDHRAEDVVAEGDAGQAEGVVEEVEGKDRRQPRQEDDPEPLPADGAVDGRELRRCPRCAGRSRRAPPSDRGRRRAPRRRWPRPTPAERPGPRRRRSRRRG